jgi:hypothetical protein
MPGIFSRKGEMKSVATVTSNDGWVFPVTKVPDMDILVARFFYKKLAYYGRDQTENKYYRIVNF